MQRGVEVKLIAAWLGLSESRVRHVISAHQIPPLGRRQQAKLYDPKPIMEAAGAHDRRAADMAS